MMDWAAYLLLDHLKAVALSRWGSQDLRLGVDARLCSTGLAVSVSAEDVADGPPSGICSLAAALISNVDCLCKLGWMDEIETHTPRWVHQEEGFEAHGDAGWCKLMMNVCKKVVMEDG
jgi:hypothetical protein